jgi:hypothetical protein
MPDIKVGAVISQETANDLYRQAYRMVYNDWPKDGLGKHWKAAVANAATARMDFKTFVLFVICGYSVTHPGSPFFPVNLSAPGAPSKLEGYRKACINKYGIADYIALGLLLDIEFKDIHDELLLSETGFGRWIVGSNLRKTGDRTREFYSLEELGLSPYWLATEPTYHQHILLPHLRGELEDDSNRRRQRHLVCQVISVLKRRSHLASTIFAARSRVMPEALRSVLAFQSLTPECFTAQTPLVSESYPFWTQVGLAVQHWEAVKAMRLTPHRLWR